MLKDSSDSIEHPECFARTIDFVGEEGFNKLRNSFVTIIGLGGVGSHAATARC